jgi:hypothetical protein
MTGTHSNQSDIAQAEQVAGMIQALVDQFDRTFSSLDHQAALRAVTHFLEGLDEPTLRSLAYQQGLVETVAGPGKPGDEEC